jgi:DNA polymerase-4
VAGAGEGAGGREVLHVDMDAFYASVEVLHDPALAGRPVIVGGSGARGVVASCSYEARAYGIHSAMPSAQARRLCPHAVFVHGNFSLYAEYSRRLHQIFSSFTPLVEGIALDEAFLDASGGRRLFGPGREVAHMVRGAVAEELCLSCSVGVGSSKLVAKLASRAAKPRASLRGLRPGAGVVVVRPGDELGFLHPLPVSSLWGVGPATLERLRRLGVTTVGELAALPLPTLVGALGTALAHHLHDLAWGRDPRPVEPRRGVKSVGHEETYAVDLVELGQLRREAVRLADAVASRLRHAGLAGRTVTVKVRFHDFSTITRAQTLPAAVDTGPEVARAATALLERIDPRPGVRLLGVSVSGLVPGGARQLSLDDASSPGWTEASRAVDEVRRRFGPEAVGLATLLGGPPRGGGSGWGPSRADGQGRPDG